jgi:hypothetical protein
MNRRKQRKQKMSFTYGPDANALMPHDLLRSICAGKMIPICESASVLSVVSCSAKWFGL